MFLCVYFAEPRSGRLQTLRTCTLWHSTENTIPVRPALNRILYDSNIQRRCKLKMGEKRGGGKKFNFPTDSHKFLTGEFCRHISTKFYMYASCSLPSNFVFCTQKFSGYFSIRKKIKQTKIQKLPFLLP